MNMRIISRATVLLVACLCLSASIVDAQSADITRPAPVTTTEVRASIAARDIGDARLTDHFYAFTGTPGDLLITVDSRNMNGDVDLFTAVGLRPLLKFSIYAGGSGLITKSVYLRQRQDLILRVEARTPNDDDAVYRIHFGGAFESIAAGSSLAENEDSSTQPSVAGIQAGKKGRRVSSAGARIDEPPENEAVTAASPEPTPEEAAEETKPEAPKPAARNARTRRPARGIKRTNSSQPAETARSETEASAATPGEAPGPASESKPAPRRRGARRGTTTRATAPEPEPEPNTGPKLVIETNDGTLIERYMSNVRRVTVEAGLVVIIGKDGKIQRVVLANVVRMTIAP